MFLNQVHFLWPDLGRAGLRRAAALLAGPLLILAVLVLPTALSMPPVTNHTELSGMGDSTGQQIHLGGSYQLTVGVVPRTGCSYLVHVDASHSGFTLGLPDFTSGVWTGDHQVTNESVIDAPDGMYAIRVDATGCGPWMVTLDRT